MNEYVWLVNDRQRQMKRKIVIQMENYVVKWSREQRMYVENVCDSESFVDKTYDDKTFYVVIININHL